MLFVKNVWTVEEKFGFTHYYELFYHNEHGNCRNTNWLIKSWKLEELTFLIKVLYKLCLNALFFQRKSLWYNGFKELYWYSFYVFIYGKHCKFCSLDIQIAQKQIVLSFTGPCNDLSHLRDLKDFRDFRDLRDYVHQVSFL